MQPAGRGETAESRIRCFVRPKENLDMRRVVPPSFQKVICPASKLSVYLRDDVLKRVAAIITIWTY